jgi:hypothetical protein
VIVVDVLRTGLVADRAHAILLADKLVDLQGADAVAPLEVIVA